MRVAFFSVKGYDRRSFAECELARGHEATFYEHRLAVETAALTAGHEAVCVFVNDGLGAGVLDLLKARGVRLVALRCAGFNNVDLRAAERLGITVARVPAYSPAAVAEHAVALILALNRKLHRAHARVREGNFSLEGLLGFDLEGKTAGIVGTGRIGRTAARILAGFGCRLLAYDPVPHPDCERLGARYAGLGELFAQSDLISLHCPLTPDTRHLIDAAAVARMKTGVVLINTSRGAVIDTRAVIAGLKSGRIGALGLDVYEEEADLFFEDLSNQVIQDDTFARLLTFPNVLITGHQAFFTREALAEIARVTWANIAAFAAGRRSGNELSPALVR